LGGRPQEFQTIRLDKGGSTIGSTMNPVSSQCSDGANKQLTTKGSINMNKFLFSQAGATSITK
jgi:hypothetical protein